MLKETKKAINFDLDTKALQEHYPNKNWRKAYDDLREFMEANSFEHRQGSGYISKEPMSYYSVMSVCYKLSKAYPWIGNCVNRFDVTEIGDTFDIKDIIAKGTAHCEHIDKPDKIKYAGSKAVSPEIKKKLERISEWAHNICKIMDEHKQERENQQAREFPNKGWER